MRIITSIFAAAALTLAVPAFAQDEPTPAASPEETASASVEATAESTPEVRSTPIATEKPAAEVKTTEKKTAPASADAGEKKTATSSASPASKKPATPAASSGKKMSVEASIREMENKWEAAIGRHDNKSVESMIASDFAGVSSKGKFTSKSAVLSEIKNNKDTFKSAKNEKLNVRIYTPSVAVVTGSAREMGTGKDGKAFDRSYKFTDTWVDRGGKWQCVASQAMLTSKK